MSADNITDLQGWIQIFLIVGGIVTVGTAGWRILNYLRQETKEAIREEHKFNVEQHGETRKVVKDALSNITEDIKEVKSEVNKINDIRVDVAVTKERVTGHDTAIKYLNKMVEKDHVNG